MSENTYRFYPPAGADLVLVSAEGDRFPFKRRDLEAVSPIFADCFTVGCGFASRPPSHGCSVEQTSLYDDLPLLQMSEAASVLRIVLPCINLSNPGSKGRSLNWIEEENLLWDCFIMADKFEMPLVNEMLSHELREYVGSARLGEWVSEVSKFFDIVMFAASIGNKALKREASRKLWLLRPNVLDLEACKVALFKRSRGLVDATEFVMHCYHEHARINKWRRHIYGNIQFQLREGNTSLSPVECTAWMRSWLKSETCLTCDALDNLLTSDDCEALAKLTVCGWNDRDVLTQLRKQLPRALEP
ncbi:hypothetical protein OIO90_003686 [Microbotryomycetes sp. JL221]|nr:hypothetical protein OIO90_003686 [Microbotryomycetes sp. JL221]